MAYDSTKVLVSRDYKFYTANFQANTALPNSNTIPWGNAWLNGGSPGNMNPSWVETGYLSGGMDFTSAIERTETRVDQELDPIYRPATGRDTRIRTGLAEFSPANILAATGQGAVNTNAAASNVKGQSDWDLTSTVNSVYLAAGADILHPGDNEAVRILVYKGQVLGSPSVPVRPAELVVIPLELAALPDTTTSPSRIAKIRDVIAALP